MVSSLSVGDVMTTGPVTARRDATFKELVDLMMQRDIGALPVVDDEGALQGIVTESDLLMKPTFGAERPTLRAKVHALLSREPLAPAASELTAEDVMSQPVSTVAPSAPVAAAARQMVDQGIGRLAVVDQEGHLVGIISRRDLLRPYDRPDDEIAAEVRATLDDPTVLEGGHQVQVTVRDGCVTLTGRVDFPSNVAVLHGTVMRVRGVVGVDNRVSAELPEPRPQGAALPEPPYGLPR